MTTVICLLVLFCLAVGLLVLLVRTNRTNKAQQNDCTVQYTCNGPIYNGQLWKR